jgi:3-oxoacyl-[acyl-carrier-protein] synthase-3
MGTRIEAVATAHAGRGPFRKGALKLADAAARACLARAHLEAGDIDLLLNAGLYREDNLAEPALAALIQEDIGANPGHPPRAGAHGTFSFDVANGGCGVLTALELLDGFVRSGTIQTGLVVASDSEPDDSESFPFPTVGGAVLVRPTRDGEGFVDFAFETFDEAAGHFESAINWHDKAWHLPLSRTGANVLAVVQGDEYERRAIECAEEATRRFLARHEVGARSIDLWILSQSPVGFSDGLAARLDLARASVAHVADEFRGAHTASPIAALDAAIESGKFAEVRTILFATVGAGIVVGLALYRK